MKNKMAIVSSVMMILTMTGSTTVLSTLARANSLPSAKISMTQAEASVKKIFSIPNEYRLQSTYFDTSSNGSYYDLSYAYTSPDKQSHYMDITISAITGLVTNFSRDTLASGFVYPLPTSQTQAQALAIAWAKKLYPQEYSQVKLLPMLPNTGLLTQPMSYQFNFERIENGIPAPFDGFSITIDQNGMLIGANQNWTSGVSFTKPQAIISPSQANAIEQKWLNLEETYTNQYQNGTNVYRMTFSLPNLLSASSWNEQFGTQAVGLPSIQATNGKVIDANLKPIASPSTPLISPLQPGGPTEFPFGHVVHWTRAQALSFAQKTLQIPATDHLTNASQSQTYPSGDTQWTFTWADAKHNSVNTTIDATNGTLQSFSYNPATPVKTKSKKTQEQINQAAINFLKQLYPQDTGGITVTLPNKNNKAKNIVTDLNFQLVVHGLLDQNDSGTLYVDPKTGQVTSYWGGFTATPKDFALPSQGMSLTKAKQLWLKDFPLQLVYGITQTNSPKVVLLYAPTQDTTSLYLDALTGNLLNPYGSSNPMSTEIRDTKGLVQAQAIAILAQYGLISVDSHGDVHPQQAMTREEFVNLVVNALEKPHPILYNVFAASANATTSSQQVSYNEMQTAFLNGWLKQGSLRNPNVLISRSEAAQIMIRALGYAAILNHPSIFQLPAKDASQIASADLPADALAYGLGLISLQNGYFHPNGHLTIADAALAIVRVATAYNEGQHLFTSANGVGALG